MGESKPKLSGRGAKEAEERRRRRAELLRENLLKRKAQQRGRTDPGGSPGEGAAG